MARNEQAPSVTFSIVKIVVLVVILASVITIIALGGKIFETVKGGSYITKQAVISGKMTAYLKPGMFMQNFGAIQEWPMQQTFYFTENKDEGEAVDQSFEVRFADGSRAFISGSCRVIFPQTEERAVLLVTQFGYRTPKTVMEEAVKKHVRNSIRLVANLMTARESYSEKRANYIEWANDMIEKGLYRTEEEIRTVTDPLTQKKTNTVFKVIARDKTGSPIRMSESPLDDMGISITNFEINKIVYDKQVEDQIQEQQKALMSVATARAEAEKAIQETKTKEEQGKAAVMQAKYEREREKAQAVVAAEQEKAVAETKASQLVAVALLAKQEAKIQADKELEVATLNKAAAEQTKAKLVLLGEGEAEARRLKLAADNALEYKGEIYLKSQEVWAQAYKDRKVPQIIMGGGGNGAANQDDATQMWMQAMAVKTLNDLGMNLDMPKSQDPTK